MVGDRRVNRINQSEDVLITPSSLASSKSKPHERNSQTGGRRQEQERDKCPLTHASGIDSANNQNCRASKASTQLNSTQQLECGQILKTDPVVTAALWARVRGTVASVPPEMGNTGGRGGQSAAGRVAGGQVIEEQKPSQKRKLNTDQDEDAEILPIGPQSVLTVGETLRTKTTKVPVNSPHFQSLVLQPRRIIEVDTDRIRASSPYSHFETTHPVNGQSLNYKGMKGLDAAEVWLSLSTHEVERIVKEYQVLKVEGHCEQEYAVFATETFLKKQSRYLTTPKDWRWRAARTIQLYAPPIATDDFNWAAPPPFEDCPEFKFDLRPDCAYWLSLAGFDSEYLGNIHNAVYVDENKWITCPYFTIEFKKHGRSLEQVKWQACAAASMALYNRYRLKSDALKVGDEQWSDSHKAQVKHYIMTFAGSKYCIWVLCPSYSEDSGWNGCFMKAVCRTGCSSPFGVRTLEAWINEIHRWGLSAFAAGCERDVNMILEDIGIEVSGIDFELQSNNSSKDSLFATDV